MEATSYSNEAENRVEISFPRPPGRFTKNALYRYGFEYDPANRRWLRDGLNENNVGKICYTFECEQNESNQQNEGQAA